MIPLLVAIDVFGVLPIGIPLFMGPPALTTIILPVNAHGYILTIVSLVAAIAVMMIRSGIEKMLAVHEDGVISSFTSCLVLT